MPVDYYWRIQSITTAKEMEKLIKQEGVEAFSEYDWLCILNSGTLTTDMVHKYRDYLDWDWMMVKMKFSVQFLEAHIEYCEKAWGSISCFQRLSWDFIEKYKNKLNIKELLEHSDNLSREDSHKLVLLYEKMNNEKNRKYWAKTLPGFLLWRERQEERRKAREKAEEQLKPKVQKTEEKKVVQEVKEEVKVDEPKKTTTKPKSPPKPKVEEKIEKEAPVPQQPVKKKRKKDFSKLSKDELKDYLKKRNIKFLYHDTKDMLMEKCEKVYYEGGEENASSTRSKGEIRPSRSNAGRGSK